MKGSELVLQTLAHHGVDTVFGYPGGAIMPIYDALYSHNEVNKDKVNHYLCRHEQGAGFSALGYAKSSGKVGVCFATSGPGATNLVTALADAKLDSIPVVAITGQVSSNVMGTDAFQEVDVLGMSLTVTKHSFLVQNIDELCDILHQAFELAQSGRPGPVLVDIPKDIQLADGEFSPYLAAMQADEVVDESAISQALSLIEQAQKPLAYVGGGVHMAGAVNDLQTWLTQTQIPATCTLKGLGSVNADYPYYLGMLGMHGNGAANYAVQSCDLLICIGARFDDRVTGKLDEFASDAKVIHLDIDPAELNKLRQADVSIVGDLSATIPALMAQNGQQSQGNDFSAQSTLSGHFDFLMNEWQAQCISWKKRYAWRYDHPGENIYGPAFLKQLSDELPQQSVVSCDVGQHQMWVAQHMDFSHPNNHLTSGGLGTMGFGLPAGIGAQLARKSDTVVTVSGDGSFMMNVQELGTIKRFNLPVKIIILDNSKLGMVRQWQQLFFEERYSETDLSDNPDFVTLASAFDIPGMRITSKDQIEQAFEAMFSWQGAFLLHVKINEMDNVWPLVPPNTANDKMLTETSTDGAKS